MRENFNVLYSIEHKSILPLTKQLKGLGIFNEIVCGDGQMRSRSID